MSSTSDPKLADGDAATNASTTPERDRTPEPPFSIFDKRQKWLIIIIVSTAATCKFASHKVVLHKKSTTLTFWK